MVSIRNESFASAVQQIRLAKAANYSFIVCRELVNVFAGLYLKGRPAFLYNRVGS